MKINFFLIVFLLFAMFNVFAVDEAPKEVVDFVDEMNKLDPVNEEIRSLNQYGDNNHLNISQAIIYSKTTGDYFTLLPGDSFKIDKFRGIDLSLEIFYGNEFDNSNLFYPIGLYDVRLSTRSLNDNVKMDFVFNTDKLYAEEYKRIGISSMASLPKGSYPIEVIVTGRDLNRKVHSDKAIFYVNVGIDSNNTDLRSSRFDEAISSKDVFQTIVWIIVAMLLVILVIGYLTYRKFTENNDSFYG